MNKRETQLKIIQKYGSILGFSKTVDGASHFIVRQVLRGDAHADSLKAELVMRRLKEDGLLVEEVAV